MFKWDFTKLSTVKYETNSYEINEEFSSISMKTDTADINFVKSDDNTCKVVCYEPSNAKHSVDTSDDTLNINLLDKRKWYEYIGINIGSQKITVYLPQTEYLSLSIKESTGDVEFYGCDANEIFVKTHTGSVKGDLLSEKIFIIQTDIGSVDAPKTATGGKCEITTGTGDIKIDISS